VVIFVGRLATQKNIALLLAVAAEVCHRSNAVFLICGDGPLRAEAEEAARSSQASERIRFLGQRNDVWGLMKASHAFVSTSLYEGQPNAVLEAMVCGCPLVVSDIPTHREFLGPATAAIVPLVKEEFVRAVLEALRRTPDVLARAKEAKRQAERHQSGSAALDYEMIYTEAALRHNRCVA
jgi:glycosyltransferase involved in cell wall biosynthesis